MTTIEDILGRINPKTAEAFKLASLTTNDLLPTPSLGLNMAIGGFGYGRQTMLWGNRSGGKTAFCLQTAAMAQRDGKSVGWIDAEKNFDKDWARRLGVDPDKMIVANITSVADMADAGMDLIRAGIDALFIDSISVLLPQSYFEDKTTDMKDLAHSGQIGTFSKNMGQACNMLNRVNEHTALVMVSQVRNQIGSYGASLNPMGGKAVEHMNSTQIKLWSNPAEKEAKKGKIHVGDIIIERPIGREVTWTVDKNRGPGMNQSNSYNFYFAGDNVGIDLNSEIVVYGLEYGILKKSGNWITFPGEDKSHNGKDSAAKHLAENPDIAEKVYGEILEKSL